MDIIIELVLKTVVDKGDMAYRDTRDTGETVYTESSIICATMHPSLSIVILYK